jgi:hypothetical protein
MSGLHHADQDLGAARSTTAAPGHIGDATILVERIDVGVEQARDQE